MSRPVTTRSARTRSVVTRSLLATTAVAVVLGLSACSTTAAPASSSSASSTGKTLRIGFSPFTLQAPALKGLADGLTAVAKAQGDSVVTADPKNDPNTPAADPAMG